LSSRLSIAAWEPMARRPLAVRGSHSVDSVSDIIYAKPLLEILGEGSSARCLLPTGCEVANNVPGELREGGHVLAHGSAES
jgi:hypothetical protein